MSTASIPRSIKILFPPMDTFRRNTIGGLLGCLGIGIFLWTWLQGLFILGQSLEKHFCKCGQPIESLDYYIVIRHDTALLIPWGWDTNKELTSLPTVRLRSNATFTSVPSDPVEPFCCRPPSEQAETLCHLIESVLERDDIPCSIFQLEKDPLHSWVKFGTFKIDKFFLDGNELIEGKYSPKLEENVLRVFETFKGDEGIIFSSTQLRSRKGL